ncbi:TetR/AcrR family transcriptional regulator [Cohnella sp. GCM10020058]|uniref:TetR/AcrR family transcriptional regulator n=1 Tax=Cohnella sp. GCM10020058 TaxID=3317330 RepID=UPI003634C70A
MQDRVTSSVRSERRDAAANRQSILDAAQRLFERHGVQAVNMKQIAIEAQVGPGTLYRRYKNKSELCLDLIRDSADLLFAEFESYLQRHRTEPAKERAKGILRLLIGFREKKAQLLIGVEDAASANRRKAPTNSPIFNELNQIFVPLFDEMAASETSSPNSVFRAEMLQMALSQFYSIQRDVHGHSPESIFEQICLTFQLG